jgi:cell division protein FtsL
VNTYVREYQKIERRARRRDNFLIHYLPTLLLLLGGVVVGKVYTQSVAIRWTHNLLELKQTVRDLEQENAELQRSMVTLSARERVAREAGEKLGMIARTEADIVWLPVLDHFPSGDEEAHQTSEENRQPRAVVRAWLDALWQEEALALTSQ